jgi:hypothetical protein
MKIRLLPLSCLLLALLPSFSPVNAQCPGGQNAIRLEIDPDEYWYEVTWQITDGSGSTVYADGGCQNGNLTLFNYCVPTGGCVVFRIRDEYGDGMLPNGYYRLFLNGTLAHENIGGDYDHGENIYLACPPGSNCEAAFPLQQGLTLTENGNEHWYVYTPDSTGTYAISTCGLDNQCPSKIWVYDYCTGLVPANNQTGAIFYADQGCDNGATATLYLAQGITYYVRVAYASGNCNNAPLAFDFSYLGPVVGCTDPTACNYNPLATVSDTNCIYPGDPDCPDAPDLVALEDVLRNSLQLDFIANADQCAVQEGCLRGTGNRYILRFTTHIKNTGTQDYYIGETPSNPNIPSDQFLWDPCHNHWHYRGYAEYLLYDDAGTRIPIGTKNGFCVLDLECSDGGLGQYSCGNMGISAGCGDIYDAFLPCQWVDITDIPAGAYTLVMRVNWDKSPDKLGRIEKDYNNNWAQACFTLAYDGTTPVVDFLDEQCALYTDCAGEAFGDAQPDCNGICNGPSLRGDWDQNTQRDDADRQAYLAAALSDAAASNCLDLHADGAIDVFDAALLQECSRYANDHDHWGLAFPCQFPGGVENEEDIVYLLPGSLDTTAKTFDIQMVNPYNKIMGYEFSVSGLEIASVENLSDSFVGDIQFDADGEILALSATEECLNKNILPTSMLRVHYSALTAPEVCLSQVTAVVNSKYQRSNALLASPNCTSTGLVSTSGPGQAAFEVFVQPNPFRERTTIFFENAAAEPVNITLSDATGRVVRSFERVRAESVTIERGSLGAGVYTFSISSPKGVVSGRIMGL